MVVEHVRVVLFEVDLEYVADDVAVDDSGLMLLDVVTDNLTEQFDIDDILFYGDIVVDDVVQQLVVEDCRLVLLDVGEHNL